VVATTKKKKSPGFFETKIKPLAYKRIRLIRLMSQVFFTGLFFGGLFGLSRTAVPVPAVVPAGAEYATVWGGLDMLLYTLTRGHFPFLILGVFFLSGVLFGRTACGWMCPFGLWQDVLSWVPVKKKEVKREDNEAFAEIGGTILWILILVSIFIGFYKYIFGVDQPLADGPYTVIPWAPWDPAGILFVSLYEILRWGLIEGKSVFQILSTFSFYFWLRFSFLTLIAVLGIFYPRSYCRWICPTGALLGYCSKYSILTISRDPLRCDSGCDRCEKACPMGVPILSNDPERIADSMCINCGACIDACGPNKALSFKFHF